MLAAYIFQVLPACTWRQIKHNHTELAATRSTTRRWTRRSIAPATSSRVVSGASRPTYKRVEAPDMIDDADDATSADEAGVFSIT